MKRHIFITMLLLICLQILQAQGKNELKLISSGKWYLEYVKIAGQNMKLTTEMQKENWVIFHEGGKQEGMDQGQKYTGSWYFDSPKRILQTNDLDGKVNQKLIVVTESELVVSVKEGGIEMIMGMKK